MFKCSPPRPRGYSEQVNVSAPRKPPSIFNVPTLRPRRYHNGRQIKVYDAVTAGMYVF